MVASDFDKEKFVHFVSFDEWQKVIDAAIKMVRFEHKKRNYFMCDLILERRVINGSQ